MMHHQKSVIFSFAILCTLIAGCAFNSTTPPNGDVGMANPASVYCVEKGGRIQIVKDKEGNETGLCQFADGTKIEEWELYRRQKR